MLDTNVNYCRFTIDEQEVLATLYKNGGFLYNKA